MSAKMKATLQQLETAKGKIIPRTLRIRIGVGN